jgi:molybdenum cofactor guanylyltransferase
VDARDLVGVILAGGASSRMGRPKEAILLDGEPLLQRQQRLLFALGVRRVLLAVGGADRVDQSGPGTQARRADQAARADGADPSQHPCLLPEMTGEIVHDPPGTGGPLAGIVAGLKRIHRSPTDHLSAGGILVLAVDMPRIETDLLRELVDAGGPGLGAAPRVEGRWEPLAAVYPREALEPAVRLLVEGGPASPSALLDELLVSGRLRAHEVPPDQVAGLRSWNTPEDLKGS